MTDFCKRLLVLAVGAIAFAGASYAQDITSCSQVANAQPQPVYPGPLNLRAEGTTELTGDEVFSCANTGVATATGAVSLFVSAPITSKALPASTLSEATLFVCTTLAQCTPAGGSNNIAGATVIQGTVSGQQVSFANVAIPAGTFFGRISNVRVNANAVTLASTLTTVTGQVLASANGTSGNTLPATVGYVFNSLDATAVTKVFGFPNITPYTTCVGNPALPVVGPNVSFTLLVGEVFGGAFKAQAPLADGTLGEQGSFQGGGANGTASFGTRVMITLANVSTGMTVFLPTSITTQTGAGPFVPWLNMTLTASATGALSAVAAAPASANGPGAGAITAATLGTFSGVTGAAEVYGASAAFTPTNGTVTAVYEVVDAPASNILGAQIPVFVSFPGNTFTTAQGPITVTVSYAPLAAASAATTVPNFNNPGTTINTTTVTVCQTNLLFPFVTSSQGFDTGIVLANTTSDLFKTAKAPGSCTMNYWGTGQPSPNVGIAAPGTDGTAGDPVTSGSVSAFLSSSLAPGFTGYAIAQCNFLDGYGYAFIENGLGTSSGVAEGYIAVNLQRPANAIIGQ